MTTDTHDRPKPPRLPRPGMVLAVLLELAMVTVFIAHRSVFGVLLAFAYAWFSATWALLSGQPES